MAWWNPVDWIQEGVEEVNHWFGWDEPGDEFGGGQTQGYVGGSTAINEQQIEQYNHTMNSTAPVNQSNGIDWGDVANTAVQIGYNEYVRNQQNKFNEEQAEANRAYQERLSNSAYQRAVADMKAAGINPAVAFGGGGGAAASSPAGGAATASTSQGIDRASLQNARIQRALANMQIKNQTALTEADVELKKAQASKELKQAGFTEKQIEYYMKHGVFPGATISTTVLGNNVTLPVGYGDTTKPGDKKPKSLAEKAGNWIDKKIKTWRK